MTYSGLNEKDANSYLKLWSVLIPLLLDDLLWVALAFYLVHTLVVLIPLLLDDLLWGIKIILKKLCKVCLNPSFAG